MDDGSVAIPQTVFMGRLTLDIMTTPNPYTEIRSGEVRIIAGARFLDGPYGDDVVLGSELQTLKEIECLLADGFTTHLDTLLEAALLTGKPPIMSTENQNST